MTDTPLSSEIQLARFRRAVDLLGGQRAAARAMTTTEHTMNERTMRALYSGERMVHAGHLRDIAAALIEHSRQCRELERQLSPAFAGNLSDHQINPPKIGRPPLIERD